MLFMVEMEVRLPDDMGSAKAEQLKARERSRAQELQRDGRWLHLWRVAGRYANVSVFNVASPDELHELLSSLPLFPYIDARVTPLARHPSAIDPAHDGRFSLARGQVANKGDSMGTNVERASRVVGDLVSRINELIAEADVTYDEYQIAKQWLIDVGEAGEWPLFLDVFVEHAVEEQANSNRAGSEGTILGPYYLPNAQVLEPPYELPHRSDEKGDQLHMTGHVLSDDGSPLAGAVLDIWHADADGLYSGFSDIPEGILRGKVLTDADGAFELHTIVPAPYMIPHDGPTGRLIAACGWHPWRPAHLHLLVSAAGYEQLTTQLYLADSEYLDSDVAHAVKDSLVVQPTSNGDSLHFDYEFRLPSVRANARVS
jgi:catechol 1,2-dioxygenase